MSQQLDLVADTSRGTGTGPAGRLRREGRIPAVLYGRGAEPVAIAVPWRELRQCLITEAGTNAIINLDVDGAKHLSMVKEIQRHPVRREVIHVDFIRVDPNVPVTVEVPVALKGDAKKVAAMQGMVDQQLFKLQVASLPSAIPNVIHVDITDLDIGSVIQVGAVPMPEGCTPAMSTTATVVQGLATRSTIMLLSEAKAAAKGGAAAPAGKGAKGGKGKK